MYSMIFKRVEPRNKIYKLVNEKLIKVGSERNFTFYSNAELEAAKTFIIDKPHYCGLDSGANASIVAIVFSAVQNYVSRAAIRETWGKQLRSRGVKLLFLVASTSDENLQDNIIEEDNIYGDLLQASFIEDYYNLTLKTIAMLDSLRNYCSQVKFVLKTDQDVLINVEKVFQVVDRYRNEQRAIFGNIFDNVVVRRNENDK
ncbi:beta-1:3-galactosyltransferase 2-like protein, partial [Dinothrombium tinctorium]